MGAVGLRPVNYNRPDPETVWRIIESVAGEYGLAVADVHGASHAKPKLKARKEAWRRIIRQTGCSMNGLATVWGCDRKSLWRAKREGWG